MMDGAIVIDLFNLNEVQLMKETMTVEVGGGCYLKDIDNALAADNLGVTLGTYPYTGIGGLITAGGVGHLGRLFGLACDNIVAAEVVLADGEIVIATDSNSYADLLWGIRGGGSGRGGGFGIVTKFTLQVHPLPSSCIAGYVGKLAPTIVSAVEVYSKLDAMMQVLLFS